MVTNSFLVLVTNCLIYLGTGHKVPSIFSVNLSGSYLEKDSFKRFGWGWVLQPGWLHSGAWTETFNLIETLKGCVCCIFASLFFKACVHYFSWNFYFSPNGSPSKTMKYQMFFISSKKLFSFSRYSIFVFSSSPLFLPVSHCFRGWF